MKYRFWGWEHADAKAITAEYKGIETPVDLCAADESELDKRKYDTWTMFDHRFSCSGYLRR